MHFHSASTNSWRGTKQDELRGRVLLLKRQEIYMYFSRKCINQGAHGARHAVSPQFQALSLHSTAWRWIMTIWMYSFEYMCLVPRIMTLVVCQSACHQHLLAPRDLTYKGYLLSKPRRLMCQQQHNKHVIMQRTQRVVCKTLQNFLVNLCRLDTPQCHA